MVTIRIWLFKIRQHGKVGYGLFVDFLLMRFNLSSYPE